MIRLLPLLLSLLLSGCASVSLSHESGRNMCLIKNSSWRLFNAIPIASGNPDRPNSGSCCWFTNTATLENNIRMLDAVRVKHGATAVRNPVSYTTDEMVLFLLFKRSVYHTSAELIFDPVQP